MRAEKPVGTRLVSPTAATNSQQSPYPFSREVKIVRRPTLPFPGVHCESPTRAVRDSL